MFLPQFLRLTLEQAGCSLSKHAVPAWARGHSGDPLCHGLLRNVELLEELGDGLIHGFIHSFILAEKAGPDPTRNSKSQT